LAFYIFLSLIEQDPVVQRPDQGLADFNFSSVVLELRDANLVDAGSMTAVLPVTLTSLSTLRNTLSPFVGPSNCVSKVLVVCPESLLSQARAAIRRAVRSAPESVDHPDISLYPWVGAGDLTTGVLQAATQASTKWLLLLDDTGLSGLSDRTRETLLCPVAADLPIGPRGVVGSPGNWSCAPPSPETVPALYLLPPFALPSLLVQVLHEDWVDLGLAIALSRKDRLGGVVRSFGDADSNSCNHPQYVSDPTDATTFSAPFPEDPFSTSHGVFGFLLPNIDDLHVILQLACQLHDSGHSIKILLYSESRSASGMRETYSSCYLQYDTVKIDERNSYAIIYDWLDRLEHEPDVIFTVNEPPTQSVRSEHATIIRIPRDDLMHAHWMGTLSLREWMSTVPFSTTAYYTLTGYLADWNVPQIEISIITQDRPRSLERLLSSLSRGRFFGDSVTLRMNLEQSSDLETIRIVGAYQWSHGSVFTHRRVVHGGLLPAVVESWYPHSNDSYGLLLEDDVELSPLFYAWIKMGILQYRSVES
jgi:hypothetical protein